MLRGACHLQITNLSIALKPTVAQNTITRCQADKPLTISAGSPGQDGELKNRR